MARGEVGVGVSFVHEFIAQQLAGFPVDIAMPANRSAEVRAEAARYINVPTIDVDPTKFGAPAEKRRLLARWQREIGDALK